MPELKRARVLSAIDGEALALLCTSYVRWQDAEEFLEKHGTVYPIRGADGQIRCFQQFPQVSIARNMALLVRGMLLEFGMTPAARSRVELPWVEGPADVDPDCTRDRFGNPI